MSDLAASYEAVLTANFCGIAVITVLVFDWIISSGSEVNLIWRAPKTSASLLYVFNRYCIMLEWTLGWLRFSHCSGLYWAEVVLGLFSMLGPALFSSLRVYALSGQHRVLTGLTLGLVLMPFFINVSTDYQSHPVNLDPPYNCYLDSTTSPSVALALTFLSRAASTLADFIAIAATWRTTYRSSRLTAEVIHGPTLHQVVLYNVLATLNILHIVLTALSFKLPSGSESYVINFIDPIGSILVCRFLLSLQEAQQNTRPSSGTTSSFVAPDFVGSASASQLPSFAAPLDGFVHTGFDSFWNSDLDYAWDTASELERRESDSTVVTSETEKDQSVSTMEGSGLETPV